MVDITLIISFFAILGVLSFLHEIIKAFARTFFPVYYYKQEVAKFNKKTNALITTINPRVKDGSMLYITYTKSYEMIGQMIEQQFKNKKEKDNENN